MPRNHVSININYIILDSKPLNSIKKPPPKP